MPAAGKKSPRAAFLQGAGHWGPAEQFKPPAVIVIALGGGARTPAERGQRRRQRLDCRRSCSCSSSRENSGDKLPPSHCIVSNPLFRWKLATRTTQFKLNTEGGICIYITSSNPQKIEMTAARPILHKGRANRGCRSDYGKKTTVIRMYRANSPSGFASNSLHRPRLRPRGKSENRSKN